MRTRGRVSCKGCRGCDGLSQIGVSCRVTALCLPSAQTEVGCEGSRRGGCLLNDCGH